MVESYMDLWIFYMQGAWIDDSLKGMTVTKWVSELVEKLEVLRDGAVDMGRRMSEKRKEGKDKGRKYKELEVGEKVKIRIPVLIATLEDSWEGPYTIVKKYSAVPWFSQAQILHFLEGGMGKY